MAKKGKIYEVAISNYLDATAYIEADSERDAQAIAEFLASEEQINDWELREIDEFFEAEVMDSYTVKDFENQAIEHSRFFSKNDLKELGYDAKTKKHFMKELDYDDLKKTYNGLCAARSYALLNAENSSDDKEKARYKRMYNMLKKESEKLMETIDSLSK